VNKTIFKAVWFSSFLLLLSLLSVSPAYAGIVFTFGANVTAERQAALQAAAAEIEQIIDFRQTVKIGVSFKSLPCNDTGAILGFAGPEGAYHTFPGAPQSNVWYVSAQAADLELAPAMAEATHISAQFNNDLGKKGCLTGSGWYYGTDHNPPQGQNDFLSTAVHEFMHGLGFLSFTGSDGKLMDNDGTANSGRLDNYSTFLFSNSTAKSWKIMTDSQRAASILSNNNLVWNGTKATSMISLLQAGTTNGKARLYAPSKYESGSSTSHFDVSLLYDSAAHELMEPIAASPEESVLASAAFCDMGWRLLRDTDGDKVNDCSDSTPLLVVDTDGDGLTDVLDAFPTNAAASVDTDKDGMPDQWNQPNPYSCTVNAATCNGLTRDGDADNDGVLDTVDNCPQVVNANQWDWNNNGIGDVCGDPLPMPDTLGAVSQDRAGAAVAFAGDVDKDGYGDYVIGIPGYDIPATGGTKIVKDAGRAVVISSKTNLELMSLKGVAAKDALGSAVAGNADVNGDGFDDVVVGAPREDGPVKGFVDAGSVTVISGKDGTQLAKIMGSATKEYFGSSVALGDVNNDGNADIIVGAPLADDVINGLKDAGSVTVISGNGFTTLNTIFGATIRANAGTSVAAGDINNDGDADIIVGAPNDGGTGSVKVYSLVGTVLLQKSGAIDKAQFGKSVASGDVNKNGFDDVLVGSPGDDDIANKLKDVGSITVFSGNGGAQLSKYYGAIAKAYLGSSVAAGDVNGDGYADVIAGAPRDETGVKQSVRHPGSVSVWRGDKQALIKTLYGNAPKDLYGSAVSAGDIDGDGKSDVIIGVSGDDVPETPTARLLKDAGSVQFQSGAGL
jgi:hypothetical protein